MAKKTCLVVRHVNFEGLGMLCDILRERNYEFRYADAASDNVCCEKALDDDLMIVLGGPFGVYEADKYPFIKKEIDCIKKRLDSNKPLLGICLGAQMMATALGAKVAFSGGKEIGWHGIKLTDEGKKSLLAPLEGQPVLHWHGDNCEMPKDCIKLAYNDFCPVQAFQVAPHQLGLQFHMEVEAGRIERWIESSEESLKLAGLTSDDVRAQAIEHGEAAFAVGNTIFNNWFDHIEARA
ncbi:MAG: glutamine amidotransferase [Pseudomonadota bacterium]